MQQHRPRNVETPPGPEVGREEEGVHPHASEDPLHLCDQVEEPCWAGETGVTRKPNGWMLGGDLLFVLSVGHLLPLSPQHSWLLVPSHLLFLRSREKSPEASFQPVTALMGILLFPFLPSASEELPSSLDSTQCPQPREGAPNSQDQDLPNSGQTLGGLNFLNQ